MPVHFLDLASAVEKLRWAEKEWRELESAPEAPEADREERETPDETEATADEDEEALILS